MIEDKATTTLSTMGFPRAKLSALVISFNRANLIATCLKALSFADEIIVVDKSSTDGTAEIAACHADRVISVPWSPVVEETRTFAVTNCQYDWILCLDDDECLSVEAARYIELELAAPKWQIYALPQRHYIMGIHDERAYYWPEHQPRLFHRDAVRFTPTVHGGTKFLSTEICKIPPDGGVCIHHLSHRDAAQWIDKANRYTSMPDRLRAPDAGRDLIAFSHRVIDEWQSKSKTDEPGSYPTAAAVLRAIYDIIDRIKTWEEEEGLDGNAAFRRVCRELETQYAQHLPHRTASPISIEHPTINVTPPPPPPASVEIEPDPSHEIQLVGSITALRDSLRHVRDFADQTFRQIVAVHDHERQATMATTLAQQAKIAEFTARIAELQASLATTLAMARAEIESEQASSRDAQAKFDAKLGSRDVTIKQLKNAATTSDAQLAVLAARQREAENAQISLTLAKEAAEGASETWKRQADSLATRIHVLETSTVWRVTAPLRNLGSRHPALARQLRRGLQVAWWTLTLQLRQHYRWWRHARAERNRLLMPAPPEQIQVPPVQASVAPVSQEAATPVQSIYPAVDITGFAVCSSANPTVSVIIPTYGQVPFTLRCLKSLASHPSTMPIEVIVTDDASGDPDIAQLAKIDGIEIVQNEKNLGFIGNCNKTAKQAKGEYLLFLNNDTELLADCIDNMVKLARSTPDCGIVGAMLLFPDGTLQEAGGIIWNDASGWNYGRGDIPDKPEYSYVRDIDYCSGACLLIGRTLFERLGQFDPEYTPAYYEDVDLAFRVRETGLRVMYEPTARIIHHEGKSHGTDVTAGVKAYQLVNQQKIVSRWGKHLASEHYPNGAHKLRARDRAYRRDVVLFIDHYVPEPDKDAGSRVVIGFLQALVSEGMVVKFWPANLRYDPVYTRTLQRMGVETLYGDHTGGFSGWMRENGSELDTIILSRPNIAADHFDDIQRYSNCPVIYYGVDLHACRMRLQAEATGNTQLLLAASATEKLEREIWRKSDLALYLSQDEVDIVLEWEPSVSSAWVTPYGFTDFPEIKTPPKENLVLFVAGFAHPPNSDAAIWLVEEIVPAILGRVPSATFALVGSNPTEAVLALARPGITVTGYVSDATLQDYYRRARVAVVPLRFGAGVKSKVVEPLREGVPLVTTPVGLQGLPGAGHVARWGTTAQELATHVVTLLTDDPAWTAQAQAQIAYARENFSFDSVRRGIVTAIQQARQAFRRRRPQHRDSTPSPNMSRLFEGQASGFSVIQMQEDGGGAAMVALRAEMPRLGVLVDLFLQNRLMAPAAYGYPFQLQIIAQGSFDIPSVTDDGVYRSTVSVLLNDKTVFYGFDRNPNLLLAALFLADGYPICGIVIPSRRIMINLGDPIWGLRIEHLHALQRVCSDYQITPSTSLPGTPPIVITGDPNFAHHAWNQLSALQTVATLPAAPSKLRILTTHEPLGTLGNLFPEARGWSVEYCADTYLEQQNGPGRIFVIPGGFHVPLALRKRLLSLASTSLGAAAQAIAAQISRAHGPVFWFSIRTRNRTPTNQLEALTSLSRAVLDRFPRACIILDGHSLAGDSETNPSYNKAANQEIIAADREVASAIISQLVQSGKIGSEQAVIPMVGFTILESIAVAQYANVYFCHHGTVQHKIGWFTNAVGIVHCNTRTLRIHPAKWVAAQVEGSIEPIYIDEALVEDEAATPGLSMTEDSLRTESYRFRDLVPLSQLIVDLGNKVASVNRSPAP